MIELLALVVVVLTGVFFACLGAVLLAAPEFGRRFLLGFASSSRLHYLELACRLVVGGAFLVQASATRYPPAFTFFGWLLVLTTLGLVLVPWRLHRRFAQWAVPQALHFLPLLGLSSLLLAGLVFFAVSGGAV